MIDFSTLQGLTIPVMTKRIKLTNLVPTMDLLTFTVSSSSGTCEMSTEHTKYNSKALCSTGVAGYNEMYALTSQKFQLIPDHSYYACVEVYQEAKLGSVDLFWPAASPSIFGGQATGNAGTWKKCSNVTTRTSFTAGEYPVRLDFNNGGTAGKMWYDGLMLIDLTEAFGAGNEPNNAWCQANIPYFTGSHSLDISLSSPVQATVTQIADASGRVLWMLNGGKVILQVEKITATTYAGETSYADEQFILLDIYPKTNGTVSVTYGGLTKTITDTSGVPNPNAQQVFFGTFNGVSDAVETPANGELTIDGECNGFGAGEYQSGSKTTTVSYCGCITDVVEWGRVSNIKAYAFINCENLSEINVPSSVKNILGYAFYNCNGLTNVVLDCNSVSDSSFEGCTAITTVTIGKNVKNIVENPFSVSNGLISFVVDEENRNFSSDGGILFNKDKTTLLSYPSVSGHYDIPIGVINIGSDAFEYNENLTSVAIPEGVASINSGAFYSCTSLTISELPNSITSIKDSAFQYCSSLALTSLPSGITSIEKNAFYNCTSLALTSLPSGITSIGQYAFSNCSSLTLTSLPSGITSIGQYAFRGCDHLALAALPSGITSIEDYTFYGCKDIPRMTIPEGVVTIGRMAFAEIPDLALVVIPSTVTTIGDNAFSDMDGTIRIYATTPPTLGENVFRTLIYRIIVPHGCAEVYKAAEGWSEYAKKIVEAS